MRLQPHTDLRTSILRDKGSCHRLLLMVQDDGESGASERAGGGCALDEQAANQVHTATVASMAQAALEALPCVGMSEGSRLMTLCSKCVEVESINFFETTSSFSLLFNL